MEKIEVNKFIPFGATLQDVLRHPTLTDSKLKGLLRLRGIYIEDGKSEEMYPLLLSTILSPVEFEYIKENLKSREDVQKMISRPIEWHNPKDLIEVIPDTIDLNKLVEEANLKYKIVSKTNFAPIDGDRNRVRMEFKCETNNYNSGWYRSKNEFQAEIVVEKVVQDNKVYLKMIYTSPETLSIADLAVKGLVKDFKTKSYTKPESVIERILYNTFNNEQRIAFFLSLTDSSNIFTFQRATDLDISPDKTLDMPVEISKLMTGGVNILKINGESLHENYLIKEKANHKYIELAQIEALYDFSYHAGEGSCVVRFGFNGYFKKRLQNIEFSIDVSSVNLTDQYSGANKEKIRLFLLQEFEKFKINKYNIFKNQQTTPNS